MNLNDQIKVNGVIYRQRFNECAQSVECKCHTGQKHGPYWFANDGVHSAKYVGKQLPAWVLEHIDLLKRSGPRLKAIRAKVSDRRDKARAALDQAERELSALRNLDAGEYTASEVLKSLGLEQFNGHQKE